MFMWSVGPLNIDISEGASINALGPTTLKYGRASVFQRGSGLL